MRHLIDITDLSNDEIELLADTADRHHRRPRGLSRTPARAKSSPLFSSNRRTRTRLSFEAAMLRAGRRRARLFRRSTARARLRARACPTRCGRSAATPTSSPCATRRRARRWSPPRSRPCRSSTPATAATSHPTQTLADLLTIRREKGRLDDLTIGFCGDLKFGRTVHSLITALARYEDIRFVFISPDELSRARIYEQRRHRPEPARLRRDRFARAGACPNWTSCI